MKDDPAVSFLVIANPMSSRPSTQVCHLHLINIFLVHLILLILKFEPSGMSLSRSLRLNILFNCFLLLSFLRKSFCRLAESRSEMTKLATFPKPLFSLVELYNERE